MAENPNVCIMMPMREEGTHLIPWLTVEQIAAKRPNCTLRAVIGWHVVTARNECVRGMLREDHEYILMVDDDTIIPPDTIDRLLALDADIATGITPIIRDGILMTNVASKDLPTNCEVEPRMAAFGSTLSAYSHDIETCGLSCVLIRRRVFETLGFPCFDWEETRDGQVLSEDFLFCKHAREAGFTIRADVGLICGHLKTIDLSQLVCRRPHGPLVVSPREASIIDPYATHLPALLACLAHTTGSVLELGCGSYSTPVLSEVCRTQARRLVTAEGNKTWHDRIQSFNGTHELVYVPDWADCKLPDERWGMAFVDHAPADRRVPEIRRLAKAGTEFIVVHDTEQPEFYGYAPLFDEFKHHYTYKGLSPWTTIFSNGDNWPAVWSTEDDDATTADAGRN